MASETRKYVYKLIFPNGKFYFGSTHDIKERWRGNGDGYRDMAVYSAIKEFGWENIKKEIVLFLSDDDVLIRKVENALIREHKDNCYNYMCNPNWFRRPPSYGKLVHVWTIDGVVKSGKEWCELYKRDFANVSKRIRFYGMSPLEALTSPLIPREMRRTPEKYWEQVGFEYGKDKRSYITPREEWPEEYSQIRDTYTR